jgi:hypothetical protein
VEINFDKKPRSGKNNAKKTGGRKKEGIINR